MLKKSLPIAVILTMVWHCCPLVLPSLSADADVTLTSVMRQEEPITWYGVTALEISTFDPQRASDASTTSTRLSNLFLGLTDINPLNPNEVLPELATSWEVQRRWPGLDLHPAQRRELGPLGPGDGHGRSDPPGDGGGRGLWYQARLRPASGCVLHLVSPTRLSWAATMCRPSPLKKSPMPITTWFRFEALDDTTLVVNLQFAAGYFFSMTPMWMLRPVPQETIAEFGDDWTDLGNIVTNGPWVLDEYVRGVRRVYLRNPHLPRRHVRPRQCRARDLHRRGRWRYAVRAVPGQAG